MIQVKETHEFEKLGRILSKYEYNPYKHHQISTSKIKDNFFLNTVKDKNKRFFYFEENEKIKGFSILSHSGWDSKILGIQVGKIDFLAADGDYDNQLEIKNILFKGLIKKWREDDIRYILCRINSEDLSSINVLISHGFILIDGILTFSLHLKNIKPDDHNSNIETRLVHPEETEQVKQIARESFKIDRFHSDPIIPEKLANKAYESWAENSCKKIAADAVIVGLINDQIASFVTCKKDKMAREFFGLSLGIIDLVATDKRFRKKGLARSTTYGVLNWFRNNGIELVEVGTQISNIAASRLYESLGFKLISTSLTFRKYIG